MQKKYTKEQLKIAYILNLCALSLAKILDAGDRVILDQEYEDVFANLLLEQLPEEEELQQIIRRIRRKMQPYRLSATEKEMIGRKKEYRIRQAVWKVIANPGILLEDNEFLFDGRSLVLETVDCSVEDPFAGHSEDRALSEKNIGRLQKLNSKLADAIWHIAGRHSISQLCLTERQIRQYIDILKDKDTTRKYERLHAIREHFSAYPPFFCQMARVANTLFHYDLFSEDGIHEEYMKKAVELMEQYRSCSMHELLREDSVSALCNLEYMELLDWSRDREFIHQLMDEVFRFAGGNYQIIQILAVDCLKYRERQAAIFLLRQLLNEQYNVKQNAQFLSALYVSDCINEESDRGREAFDRLCDRVDRRILYPMPTNRLEKRSEIRQRFLSGQRQLFQASYYRILTEFREKYRIRSEKAEPEEVRSCLQEMYTRISQLDFMTLSVRSKFRRLFDSIDEPVTEEEEGKTPKTADDLFNVFFGMLGKDFRLYIDSRMSMLDISIAEENLFQFCLANDLSLSDPFSVDSKRISSIDAEDLAGADYMQMIALIRKWKASIVVNRRAVEFYLSGDARIERYFHGHPDLQERPWLKVQTLAILEEKTIRGQYDMLFTVFGIIPVRQGIIRHIVPYEEIRLSLDHSQTALIIDGPYRNDAVNLTNLNKLCDLLDECSLSLPSLENVKNIMEQYEKRVKFRKETIFSFFRK